MSARTDDDSVLPHEAAAPAFIVTPAKAGVHAGTGTTVERWTPAFAGVTGGGATLELSPSSRRKPGSIAGQRDAAKWIPAFAAMTMNRSAQYPLHAMTVHLCVPARESALSIARRAAKETAA